MKKLCLLLLCVILLLSVTACGEKDPQKEQILFEDSEPVQLVPNAAISRFIQEYNAASEMTLHDYNRLDNVNEYVGEAYECKIYMTDNTDNDENPQLRVTILGGTTEEMREQMFAVFSAMAPVLDAYASTQQINDAVTYLAGQTMPVSGYRVSGYLEVETYMPTVDTGTGVVDCRIDLVAHQYIVE